MVKITTIKCDECLNVIEKSEYKIFSLSIPYENRLGGIEPQTLHFCNENCLKTFVNKIHRD